MMSPWYLTLLLALGCAGTSRPDAPPGASEENLLLDGLTVISMTGAPPREPTSILIRGGRIAALYPTGSRLTPAGARVLDLRGRYAIPGLIDAHVHLTSPFVRPGQQDSLARFFLQGGITTIRDMAGDGIVLQERARAAGHGASVSPRIFYSTIVASPEFFRTERRAQSIAHGGTPGRLAWAWAIAADSDAATAAAGARQIGATGIKAYAELSPALLEAASREAHARGLKVWSHATVTPAKPSDAVAAGVDVLSHASYLVLETKDSLPRTYGEALDLLTYDQPASSPAIVRLFSEMQRRGTMLDATLVVARRMARSRSVTEGSLRHMQGVDAWAIEASRLAHRAGVRLVAGTDVSGYPGQEELPTLHDELAMYVEEVGLTPIEALATATRNAAEMLGAAADLGAIESGKLADLVILDADPLSSIRNTRRLAYVVKGGVMHAVGSRGTEPERDTLDWKPSWPRTQMAVLRGDPSGHGPFVFRFRMPGGYWIHPHSHPGDARIRTVSGTFLVGMGTSLDSSKARVLPAGSETVVGDGMIHFEGTRGETEIEVSGDGPWGVTFLDPSKNPALAQPPSPRADSFPPELDAYIATALRQWELPGAALAVVKDGQVVVAKGYGVRELGRPDSVDANTLFDAASLTKSFTAAAIASLVDEGKMAWDAPVRRYLPTLEFSDPYLTANVTLRDLLSHRTGIRRSNSAWYFTRLSRPELLALVRGMEEEAPFRSRLVYWNIGYTIAGEAAAAADGRPWEELVTQRLLVPMGMNRTTAEFDAVSSMPNYASGHAMIGGLQQVTPRETARASTAPAGAIQSSAADLATWMVFQLGDGSFRGRRILSADAMGEMHSPQIVVPTSEAFRTARQLRDFAGYGLGWQVFDYRGNRLLWHSGNGNGQLAYMALLPDLDLGVAVLINSARGGPALNGGIASRIIDHYLGGPTRDYSAELRDPWARNVQRRAEEERLHEASRLPNTTPSLPLAGYTGVFRDRLGLDVRVWLEADTLRLRYGGGETATLVHWHHDTFRARWENPLHAQELSVFVSFGLDPHGEVDRLHMDPFGDDIDARRTTP